MPIFKRNQTGISHRLLNWWTSENVIDKNINEAGRYTFTEFIWVKVIEQLRTFNVPLPFLAALKIKLFEPIKLKGFISEIEKAKQFIGGLKISETEKKKLIDLVIKESKENEVAEINLFQLIILESLIKRKSIAIAIFQNTECLIIDKTKDQLYTQNDRNLLENGTYVKVSISKLLSEFLHSDLAFSTMEKIQLLTYPENKLYECINTGEYETIIISYKDKKTKNLELKKAVDTKRKIMNVLSEGKFAEITVKKDKGIVAKIEQPLKIDF
ncbi:MAG: hypothetical protein Q8M29_04860 [Bacteroidota bacterium]|nr:hypothetical protein [Bacteroidota bacterium]